MLSSPLSAMGAARATFPSRARRSPRPCALPASQAAAARVGRVTKVPSSRKKAALRGASEPGVGWCDCVVMEK